MRLFRKIIKYFSGPLVAGGKDQQGDSKGGSGIDLSLFLYEWQIPLERVERTELGSVGKRGSQAVDGLAGLQGDGVGRQAAGQGHTPGAAGIAVGHLGTVLRPAMCRAWASMFTRPA